MRLGNKILPYVINLTSGVLRQVVDGRRGGGHDGRGRHCERERRNPVGDWRGVSGFRAWERRGGH